MPKTIKIDLSDKRYKKGQKNFLRLLAKDADMWDLHFRLLRYLGFRIRRRI